MSELWHKAWSYTYRATAIWLCIVTLFVVWVKMSSDDTTHRFNVTQGAICTIFAKVNVANQAQKATLTRLAARSRARAKLDAANGDTVAAQADLDSAAFYQAQADRITKVTFPGCPGTTSDNPDSL